MAEMERIINKLKESLITNRGFKKSGAGVTKRLRSEEDFDIPDAAIEGIMSGDLFGGRHTAIYDVIEENYITDIEETFEDFLSLTEREKTWLGEFDEDGCLGWDLISEWIWENVDVSVCHKTADRYAKEVMSRSRVCVA